VAAVALTIEGVRVESEANAHAHWRTRQRRARAQHDLVRLALARLDPATFRAAPRLRVTFTRVMGPRGRGFDSDNLVGAFKHVRDAVAAWLGRDDGDPWFDWVVSPEQVRGHEYGVRIGFDPLASRSAALTPRAEG
jgi:hypothetical protein